MRICFKLEGNQIYESFLKVESLFSTQVDTLEKYQIGPPEPNFLFIRVFFPSFVWLFPLFNKNYLQIRTLYKNISYMDKIVLCFTLRFPVLRYRESVKHEFAFCSWITLQKHRWNFRYNVVFLVKAQLKRCHPIETYTKMLAVTHIYHF